ncbi:MAG TPA: response regulator [Acetobacteraceae bacterium]|nr:response regulator [Acetobacteraceae bacterium]
MTVTADTRCDVLLVEDEELISMLMEDLLEESGCRVTATAGQLDEALSMARSGDFDLAFIDLNLRGTPAWPLAELLRERGIPFAFVTGYGAADTRTYADVPVLQKPFTSQHLAAIVDRLRGRQGAA